MLQVSGLTYTYPDSDVPALRDVTFTLAAGEILLLAGGTGAGKSTLCYALTGFVPHFYGGEMAGAVTLDGRSMQATPLGEWVQGVGLVLQNPFNQLSGARMTVWEEVAFGLENLGVPRDEMGVRVGDALTQLGIAGLAERSPYALSGGQMQRVAIASILVLRPRLLVLDEPTAQLDPAGTEEVFEVLRALAAGGSTIVLATHQLDQAAPFATRALVLHAGRVALHDAPRATLGDPRLPTWHVAPPTPALVASRLGLEPPYPVVFEEAVGEFEKAGGKGQRTKGKSAGGGQTETGGEGERGRGGETVNGQSSIVNRPQSMDNTLPLPPNPSVKSKIENRKSKIAIVVDNLHFTYPSGVAALRGVSLWLEPGRVAALIGANGAGKSTLARMLNGLLRPTRGTVQVGDWDAARYPTSTLARRVGYAFQNPNDQLFKATVAGEVAFGPQQLGLKGIEVEAAVEQALALTGLVTLRDAHPYDLPPSTRRWVAIASVLALGAPALILDEPTSGMDGAEEARMGILLATLRAAGYTLLLVSHAMQFVANHADHVFVMAEGTLLTQGTPTAVFADEAVLARTAVAPPPVARLARALGLGAEVVTVEGFLGAMEDRDQGK